MAVKLLALALVALACAASAEEVITLTDKNFDDAIKNNPLILVEFYAPWCGHCKALAPEYEKAASMMAHADPVVVLAKMDATTEEATASKFDVRGFPTLKFFKDGEAMEYTGGRTEATITSWLKKKTGPPAKLLATADEVKTFEKSADVTVVGFFAEDNEARKAFNDAAFNEEDTPFGLVTDASVASGYGVTPPAIVLFKDFDEGKVTFDGAYDKTEIGAFVAANSLPLVVPFTQESAPKIFGGDIKNHVLLFLDPKDDKTEGHVEAATEAAKQQKGKHLFVTVSPEDDRILEFFSIVAADLPTVRMVHMGDGSMRKYQYPNPEITAAGLTQFIADFDAGKLVADMKSQEPPKDNDEHPVRVIVGKNFDDEVVNNEKDVFVMFFAPWCGHCKRLQPTWHELGVKFQGVDSAVIAQMDATANEHEAVDIQGFPTIKLWPGKEKANPVDFDGSRDLDGFVAFLKTKASTPIVFPETADKKDEL